MPPRPIDLRSDTLTKPSGPMRIAMAEAEVGDEQKYEDPTTNRLQDRVAELLGKEAALFLPSGTMCNQIGVRLHCRQGNEIIADSRSHLVNFEIAGYAALSGAAIRPIQSDRGMFTAAQVEAAMRDPLDRHMPETAAVWIEQTSNAGGGTIWPLEQIEEIAALARRRGIAMHMDGARLMNAVVATGISAAKYSAPFDTAWIDFSKGLGCPVGACLVGSKDLIKRAWRLKQQLGGSMRQSGVLAAACLYALDNNVERLAEDHANAKRLAEGFNAMPNVIVEDPETNLVFIDVKNTGLDANGFRERCLEQGVLLGDTRGGTRVRMVTHLDVSAEDIETVIAVAAKVIQG